MLDSSIFLFHSPFFSCDMFESWIRHTLRTQWNWLDGHVMEAVGCVPCTKRSVAINKKRETRKVGTRLRTKSYCNLCAARRPTYVDFIPDPFIFCTGALAVRSSLHRPLYVNKLWEVQMAGKIMLQFSGLEQPIASHVASKGPSSFIFMEKVSHFWGLDRFFSAADVGRDSLLCCTPNSEKRPQSGGVNTKPCVTKLMLWVLRGLSCWVRCDRNILGQFWPIFRRHNPLHLLEVLSKLNLGHRAVPHEPQILPHCPQKVSLFCVSNKHCRCNFCRTKW